MYQQTSPYSIASIARPVWETEEDESLTAYLNTQDRAKHVGMSSGGVL